MKKYYFNDGPSQQGSSTPEEVKEKNITDETPAKTSKKSTAWLSYVLALLVVGGVGYLVYQDMEKNKGNGTGTTQTSLLTDSTSNTAMPQTTEESSATSLSANNDTVGTGATTEPAITTTPATTETVSATPATKEPATVTTNKTTTATPAKPDAATIKAQKAAALKLVQKKAEEDKKKLLAAQAAALKEKEYRNNWSKYISIGQLNYNTKGDGIDAFNVPVYNGTNATIDNVTVRVEYMKKDKKVVNKETIVITNIAPGATSYGRAPGYKKGDNIKAVITNISSRKLHFCYPSNNGNPADPYFCN